MEEIEVKILEVNVDETVKKLEAMGAEKVSIGDQEIVIFDFDDSRISKGKGLLRLRKYAGEVEFTYKQRISKEKTKIMKETEVNVSDFKTMKEILESLGLKSSRQYTKHRLEYKLQDVKFEFDTLPGIPTFLEIEAPSEDKVQEYVEKLGFKMSDAKAWTGKDVLEHYGKLRK